MYFNPRSPYGERLQVGESTAHLGQISTHAPRMGSDHLHVAYVPVSHGFQPTLPVWGATEQVVELVLRHGISTPAPRMGSDSARARECRRHEDFNPRSPYGERPRHPGSTTTASVFQPTLPVWGATEYVACLVGGDVISTHAPRMGSDTGDDWYRINDETISTHAPRMGSDSPSMSYPSSSEFQPTLPVWGATERAAQAARRAGFQPTLPVWGATSMCVSIDS